MIVLFIFFIFWGKFIHLIFNLGSSDYPRLRERFGTVLWHSSDKDGIFLGSYNDPKAIDHNYCYYPKNGSSKLIIQRIDSDDCSNWYGQVILKEAEWVSEREKYYWN